MGLLRVFGFGDVFARRHGDVIRAEIGFDLAPDGGDGLFRKLHAVGSHVGDETHGVAADVDAFIELLRQAHGLLRGEAELAAGLLLQSGGDERRRRVALGAFFVNLGDGEGAGFDGFLGGQCLGFVVEVELFELLALVMRQAGGEGGAGRGDHAGFDGPVFAGFENLDFGLALADEAERDRLHAAGGFAARQLAPEHRREGEADQIIQGAAGHVGLDERLIQLTRMGHCGGDRGFGDLVKGDAEYLHAFQRVLVLQHRPHMPGDGLALTIRVSRQIEGFGTFEGAGDLAHVLVAALVGFPRHGEVLVRADRAIFRRQVADMAEGGQDLV